MTEGAHNPKGHGGLDNPANTGGSRLNRTGAAPGATLIYGTEAEVLALVDGDATDAATAKAQELAAVAPRQSLIDALQDIIDA
jgi:hypothetical protein